MGTKLAERGLLDKPRLEPRRWEFAGAAQLTRKCRPNFTRVGSIPPHAQRRLRHQTRQFFTIVASAMPSQGIVGFGLREVESRSVAAGKPGALPVR